jgi:ubiquinone/menaquinone biosynthesis C-methylase UbiE
MNQWDAVADIYNAWMGEEGDALHKTIIDPLIFSYLDDVNNPTILDAGCGNGYFLKKLSPIAKQVVGIDFSDKLLEMAGKRTESYSNIMVRKSNIIDQIPFHDTSYDVVIASMVIQYLDRVDLFAQEVFRILKDHGMLILMLDHPAHALVDRIKLLDGKPSNKFITLESYFQRGVRKKRSLGTSVEVEYYHKTISDYLNIFSANFRLDRTNEISEDGEVPRIWGLRYIKQ